MRRQRLVAVGWARLRPAGHTATTAAGGGGGGYVAGTNEYGGGERRETWEYSALTERTVRRTVPYRAKVRARRSAVRAGGKLKCQGRIRTLLSPYCLS